MNRIETLEREMALEKMAQGTMEVGSQQAEVLNPNNVDVKVDEPVKLRTFMVDLEDAWMRP